VPQFDKITFFNQVFWLFVFFAGFYLIFLKFFLPKLGSVLKVRNKKLQKGAANLIAFKEEQELETSTFDEYFIEDTIEQEKDSILNSSEKTIVWVSNKLQNLNEENLNKSHALMEKSFHAQISIASLLSSVEIDEMAKQKK
jgi:F0F1-type ATP synthase membrane subunit b/b'